MNPQLQAIANMVNASNLQEGEKLALLEALSQAERQWSITAFKLDRTEKVKRTTAILLEETIEELELKRQAIEESNNALQLSLKELKAAQAQLVQAEKMASLGELTAGIAHEIQNPLNFVNNFSDVNHEMIDEVLEEIGLGHYDEATIILGDIKENSEKISNHGQRAAAIVKGMLQHSRSSTGQKEPTNINALCDEYLKLSYHGLRAKDKSFNASFGVHSDDSIGLIDAVPQDIGRVLLNLVNNAFYAVNEKARAGTPGYQPEVTISTHHKDSAVEIIVADNGNGIPDSIREKIFQPFFTTKPTGQGTGLGLSLSYDIIKAHGGSMQVDTMPGEYTKFIVMLPGAE